MEAEKTYKQRELVRPGQLGPGGRILGQAACWRGKGKADGVGSLLAHGREAPECPIHKRSLGVGWGGAVSWAVLCAPLPMEESEPETEPPPLSLGVCTDKGHCSHCCLAGDSMRVAHVGAPCQAASLHPASRRGHGGTGCSQPVYSGEWLKVGLCY